MSARSNFFPLAVFAVFCAFVGGSLACTKCNFDCSSVPSGWCNDSTDGCYVCAQSIDPLNPGRRCTNVNYYCAYLCSASSGSCFDQCLVSNTPSPAPTTCNKCWYRCSSDLTCAGSTCNKCKDQGGGMKFCVA